ncbi:serine/threonine protein kinase [Diaphorobacter aerolatus]|uniref:non-specific serine/threonine protein kinase n=1 Tax=Diaphorobacter aerolatus TaxID=1288495 RepID=A0A7H0GNQ6_9BURK|nr:serine/threonine-protein kinase [Diaphorobacter aerolatus]QNP49922.1 serine/threonine protein kinase [Diaphorobacter aerolatus]
MSDIPGSRLPRTVDHVDALPVGARLGEFEILGLLGVGGFGMVYQAFDHSLLRFVAVKEYMPTSLAARANGRTLWVRSSSDASSFQAGLASFVEEARLLAQFDHPSLVKVFRFWEANQTAYMVMPLYTGMTLKQARTHMRTPPTEDWLRKVIWSVCSALSVLHNGKTLHRDISPDNIFLQDNGPPVLLDLGAARFAIEDRERKHTAVLKVNYAPIEQYADAQSDLKPGPWSDIYSLAAVIYGVICNDVPLPSTLRSIRDRMVPFSRVARTVRKQFGIEYSTPFVETITKALSLQPRDRHWTVEAFLEQMGLTSAPAHLDKFDFRADLGDNWLDPQARKGSGNGTSILAGLVDESGAVAADPVSVPEPVPERRNTDHLVTVLHLPGSAEETTNKKDEKDKARNKKAAVAVAEFQDTLVRLPGDFEDSLAEPFEPTRFVDHDAEDADEADAALGSGVKRSSRSKSGRSAPGSGKASSPVAKGKPPSIGHRRGARRTLLVSAALMMLVAGAAAWYVSTRSPAAQATVAIAPAHVPTPDDEIITELAEPRSATAASAAAAHAASQAAAIASSSALPVAPSSAEAASVASTTAVAATAPPAAAVVAAKEARPRVAPVRKPMEAPVTQEPAQPALAPAQQSAPVAAQPKPARRASPEEACANVSFIGRPMCVHNQCQQPGMESHPVCVESKRKRDEERRERQMYTQ